MSELARALSLAIALIAAAPPATFAFSDPLSFDHSALAAGGGRRHFTGSPADAYTCGVCHEGGREPSLDISGLPRDGYRPGARYEIVVRWGAQVDKLATALELTDEQGRAAGSVRLPPEDEREPEELCAPASDGILAASISELADGRQIIHVPDCGSQRVRFLWIPPSGPQRTVWFSGSAVWSDGEADTAHDGVTDYGQRLSAADVVLSAGSCSAISAVMPQRARSASEAIAFAFVALLVVVRRHPPRSAAMKSARGETGFGADGH